MFVIIAPIQIKEGHRDAFVEAMIDDAKGSVANEPGCLRFDVIQDGSDPNRIWHVSDEYQYGKQNAGRCGDCQRPLLGDPSRYGDHAQQVPAHHERHGVRGEPTEIHDTQVAAEQRDGIACHNLGPDIKEKRDRAQYQVRVAKDRSPLPRCQISGGDSRVRKRGELDVCREQNQYSGHDQVGFDQAA